MSVLHLDQSNFEAEAMNAPLAMVDFWADWCGPCKMIAPVIEQLGEDYTGRAVIAKVDVDKAPAIAGQYGVMSIPTMVFLKNGVEIDRKVGVMSIDEYVQVLDANLGSDA